MGLGEHVHTKHFQQNEDRRRKAKIAFNVSWENNIIFTLKFKVNVIFVIELILSRYLPYE